MPKKTITEVYSQIDTLLADNSTGAITPLRLRTILKDLGDALKPSFASMQATSIVLSGVVAAGTVVTGFATKVETDQSDVTATIATGVIARFGGSGTFVVEGTINSSQDRVVSVSIRRGTTLLRTVSMNLKDGPQAFSLSVAESLTAAADYTVLVSSPTSTNITITNLAFRFTSSPTL